MARAISVIVGTLILLSVGFYLGSRPGEKAIEQLDASPDETKKTKTVVASLQQYSSDLRTPQSTPWHIWQRISALKSGKKSDGLVDRARLLAAAHLAHPRFHDDLRTYVDGVFALSRQAIERYREYKERRRLLDFVDLETLGLELIQIPAARKELAQRLDLLLVDEFQDTNPIQLALFLGLAELVDRVVWVGDEKQAIYGFRGADPGLVRATVDALAAPESRQTLEFSWRSRPDIVHLISSVFAHALASDGIPEERVALTPKRDNAGYAGMAALEWWLLEASNIDKEQFAIAQRVRELLEPPPTIEDHATGEPRPLRAGDVAILCYSNAHCRGMANALESVGVRAAVAQPGLLATLESRLALAALRLALDPRDPLAAADLSRLTGHQGMTPDEWLGARLTSVQAQKEEGAWEPPFADDPYVCGVRKLADELSTLSPTEALDAAIDRVGLGEHCLRWGDPRLRLANLESLRAHTGAYEEHCRYENSASTAAGLLSYLDALARADADARAEGVGTRAVQVSTYHRAKGLEWPVVICASLDKQFKPRLYEPVVEPAEKFDAARPLANRRIRLWPWPYQKLSANIELSERVAEHPAAKRAVVDALAQARRVLYVGMTRPRDQLVLATRLVKTGVKAAWLSELEDEGVGALRPPTPAAEDGDILEIAQGLDREPISAVVRRLNPAPVEVVSDRQGEVWFDPGLPHGPNSLTDRPKLHLGGSRAELSEEDLAAVVLGELELLGDPLTIDGDLSGMVLGTAIHGFFGVDLAQDLDDRTGLAQRWIDAHGIAEHTSAGDWLTAADRLEAWVGRVYPGASVTTELPLRGAVQTARGPRVLIGDADLLFETPEGWVIVDHKAYLFESDEQLLHVARGYAPQLLVYGTLLTRATGKGVIGTYIHYPIAGRIVRVTVPEVVDRVL